jgi:hypothetical protein
MTPQRDHTETPSLYVVADTEERYPDWEAIYADNAIWVHRMVFARVGNLPDAEDPTVEIFLTALKPLRMTATVAEVRSVPGHATRPVPDS